MLARVAFSFTVCFLNSFSAWAAPQCLDIFLRHRTNISTENLVPFAELRSELRPVELKSHGLILRGENPQELEAIFKAFESRDGTYPILIDKQKNIAIDHRLPNPYPEINTAFLGTHRGLYQKLSEVLGQKPQIVFAGQIRVIGGRAYNLIDQASTFYDDIKVEDSASENQKSKALAALIVENQKRLDFAAAYLKNLGLIFPEANIINFRQHFQNYRVDQANEGHARAEHVANFERLCRTNANCWSTYQKLEHYVRWVVLNGGDRYISENFKELIRRDPTPDKIVYQNWIYALTEGPMDLMSFRDMMDPATERGQGFADFIKYTPKFLDVYLKDPTL